FGPDHRRPANPGGDGADMRTAAQIAVLLGLAVGVVGAIAALEIGPWRAGEPASSTPPRAPPAAAWAAVAPGGVERRSGEVRVAAAAIGRIVEVPVRVGDRVAAGDVLVRLDDQEARARVAAAKAEVTARKLDRDEQATAGAPEHATAPARA